MKSLSASYLGKLAASENKPRLLYELELASGTLYLCDGFSNVTFPSSGGQTYTALALEFDRAEQSGDEIIDSVIVSIDNVSKLLGKYVVYESFRGRKLTIKRVFQDLLSDADDVEIIFQGLMREPTVDQYKIQVEAVAGLILKRKEPKFNYTRQCRWELGGEECAADISAYEVEESNAPDSGSTTTLVDSGLSATADIYENGLLECDFTDGTYDWTEKRRITAYNSGTKTITVGLAFSLSTATATRWKAIAGCDKTYAECHDKFKNLLSFGGFVHVR